MIYYKLLLFQLLIGFALCYYTNSTFENDVRDVKENQTTEVPIDNVAKNKVNITLYYEALCPASVSFLREQLKPTVQNLASYLDVHLVPYGFAETRLEHGQYKFKCQHGPVECYANRIHACALHELQNNTQAVLLNSCLMQYYPRRANYTSVLNSCGNRLQLNVSNIWDCLHTNRGFQFLKDFGLDTEERQPPYVPYVVINGMMDEQKQDQASANLMSTVCEMLLPQPPPCLNDE